MSLQETNSIIAICVTVGLSILFLSFAWVQWRYGAHEVIMRREAERTLRWKAYFEAVAPGDSVTPPHASEPPDTVGT